MSNQIPLSEYQRVLRHYNGDTKKTIEWFKSPNFHLNGRTPMQALKDRRISSVVKCIDEQFKN